MNVPVPPYAGVLPDAVTVTVVASPWQAIMPIDTVATGMGFTLTIIGKVIWQDPALPVAKYVVVTEGLAVTGEPVVAFKPEAGVHENVAPTEDDDALNEVEEPPHMVALGLTVTISFTVIVVVAVLVQPGVVVPITV